MHCSPVRRQVDFLARRTVCKRLISLVEICCEFRDRCTHCSGWYLILANSKGQIAHYHLATEERKLPKYYGCAPGASEGAIIHHAYTLCRHCREKSTSRNVALCTGYYFCGRRAERGRRRRPSGIIFLDGGVAGQASDGADGPIDGSWGGSQSLALQRLLLSRCTIIRHTEDTSPSRLKTNTEENTAFVSGLHMALLVCPLRLDGCPLRRGKELYHDIIDD